MNRSKLAPKILLGALGAGLVMLLVLACVNMVDEDLNPAVGPLLEMPGMALAPDQNGYLYLRGFDAAADKDPHAVGMEIEKLVRAHFGSGSLLVPFELDVAVMGQPPVFSPDLDTLCDATKGACLEVYVAAAAKITELEHTSSLYLQRYARLIAYPGYEDRPIYTLTGDLFPNYGAVSATSSLAMARAALSIAAGEHSAGAERFAADMRFWRQALAGSQHVLGKTVAAKRIEANLELLNELMVRYPGFAQAQATLLAETMRPLTAAEINYCAVSRHERAAAFRQFHAIGQRPWQHRQELGELARLAGTDQLAVLGTLAPIGYAPAATLNLMLELNDAEVPVCSTKPPMLIQARQRAQSRMQSLFEERARGLAWLYNPTGKAFLRAVYPDTADYLYRLHDLDGYLRATALHHRIRAAQVGDDAIPGLIAQAGAPYHDPYTDKPIVWNMETRTLTVTQNALRARANGALAVIEIGKRIRGGGRQAQ